MVTKMASFALLILLMALFSWETMARGVVKYPMYTSDSSYSYPCGDHYVDNKGKCDDRQCMTQCQANFGKYPQVTGVGGFCLAQDSHTCYCEVICDKPH
ncbi:hypothetical protein ACP4OV_023939 [Aristida adscensionis]